MDRDKLMMAIFIACGAVLLAALIMGLTDIYYYPMIVLDKWSPIKVISFIVYVIMLVIPVVMDLDIKKKWQLSK